MNIKKLLNIIFPVKCACCQKISESADSEDILCQKCREEIDEVATIECAKCKKPPHLCRCKALEHIDEVVFAYFYAGDKLKRAIYKMKRANLSYINEFFAKAMYASLKSCGRVAMETLDAITYAPRMKSSINYYGYNQTEMLARLISKYAGIAHMPTLVASSSYKKEQKSLNKTQRAQNVKNKFSIAKKIKKSKVGLKGKNILIIDDVTTSGSTLSECAKVLKAAGAKNVYALCAASVL